MCANKRNSQAQDRLQRLMRGNLGGRGFALLALAAVAGRLRCARQSKQTVSTTGVTGCFTFFAPFAGFCVNRPSSSPWFRMGALYTDKILRGTKPEDLRCNSRNCCRNGSQLGESSMMPIRWILVVALCACAASGHPAKPLPRSTMNPRRLIRSPGRRGQAVESAQLCPAP
jgi:hypothetical protein